jgi:hypothetical protein
MKQILALLLLTIPLMAFGASINITNIPAAIFAPATTDTFLVSAH